MNTTTITHSPATKVSISITARQLWLNFMATWAEIAWDSSHGTDTSIVDDVAKALISSEPLDTMVVRKIFEDGHTILLLDSESMAAIDKPNTLAEVIVVHGDQRILIPHEFVNY